MRSGRKRFAYGAWSGLTSTTKEVALKSVSIATHTICLTALASLAMGASSWLATSALLKKSPTAASNTPKSKGASSAKKDDI